MSRAAILALVLVLGGCGPFRRAKTPPPPGPMPARIPEQVTNLEPAPPPKNLPPPPVIGVPKPEAKPAATAAALGLPVTPTTPPPRPARKKRAIKRTPPPPPPQVVTESVEEAVSVASPYRLGELRSTGEREHLRRQAEQWLTICAAAQVAAEGRALTPMQAELLNRVKTFSVQAREVIEKDPSEARSFAAKGKTFAEALLAELK